ncbi:MAG TPA: HAMP domain-containing sensor histidine kinase, partial [Myxococcaceae bacterium]|nr:HAMP domain-containing sensor histidine kinase [Myxococcaceae bacterium]
WEEAGRLRQFAGNRFADVWTRPLQREALADAIAQDLEVGVALRGADRHPLSFHGRPCRRPGVTLPVRQGGQVVGSVEVCSPRLNKGPWRILPALLAAVIVIWAASGRLARHIARPLTELAQVAQDIGRGKLSSRARLDGREGEVRVLGEAVNDMAVRIERQLAEQRELLAGVSHELRTPLARMRLLVELGRGGQVPEQVYTELEREVVEVDALVGELLANARLDFTALDRRRLDGGELMRRALERAGLPASLLLIEAGSLEFQGDPTLVARALANLLDNARRHGGGPLRVQVREEAGELAFEVEDDGPGFAAGEEARAFTPFYRGQRSARDAGGSLGLGLALVRRIAEAHGGRAWAGNRPDGGACVAFSVGTKVSPPDDDGVKLRPVSHQEG